MMPVWMQLVALYGANLVLDYPLQCEFLKEYKQKSHFVMFIHCCIWGIGLSLVLYHFGRFQWYDLVSLISLHFLVDTWKARGWYKKMGIKVHTAYFIDQTIHVFQLLVTFFI